MDVSSRVARASNRWESFHAGHGRVPLGLPASKLSASRPTASRRQEMKGMPPCRTCSGRGPGLLMRCRVKQRPQRDHCRFGEWKAVVRVEERSIHEFCPICHLTVHPPRHLLHQVDLGKTGQLLSTPAPSTLHYPLMASMNTSKIISELQMQQVARRLPVVAAGRSRQQRTTVLKSAGASLSSGTSASGDAWMHQILQPPLATPAGLHSSTLDMRKARILHVDKA